MEEKSVCIREQANVVQINRCRAEVASKGRSFAQLSNILSLAGNDVRLKILYLLEEEQELCPCDISDILSMSIPAVSQHLRKMKDGNIIRNRKQGQTIFYSLRPEHSKILHSLFKYINILNLKLEAK